MAVTSRRNLIYAQVLMHSKQLCGVLYKIKVICFLSVSLSPPKQLNPLNAELNPIRHLLALVGARHIVHVSRIRVNVTFTESRVQCREGGKQPLSSKRFADDCMCLTLGAFCTEI